MTNATIARVVTPEAPDVVVWMRTRASIDPMILALAWVGPVLALAGALDPAVLEAHRIWLVLAGLVLTAVAIRLIVPPLRRAARARALFAGWVDDHLTNLTPVERRYFAKHSEAAYQTLWGKTQDWMISGYTDKSEQQVIRLIAS